MTHLNKSLLPLTDPCNAEAQRMLNIPYRIILSTSHHMVIKQFLLHGLAAEYRSRWWVWSTVVRRPSEVYDNHRRTKLTAPEIISHSRDGENRHLNLSHLCLAPPLGWPRWNLAYIFGIKKLESFGYRMAFFAWS